LIRIQINSNSPFSNRVRTLTDQCDEKQFLGFIHAKLDNVCGLIDPAPSNPPNLLALILENQLGSHQPASISNAFFCLISEGGDKSESPVS
jgi:hypothetical protein